jgi:hypothetical protein
MTMVYMGAAIAALGAALFFALRAWWGKREEAAGKEAQNAALRESIKARDRYAEKKEEIRDEAEKKKDSFRTGDGAADFANSVGVLHNARGGGPPSPGS